MTKEKKAEKRESAFPFGTSFLDIMKFTRDVEVFTRHIDSFTREQFRKNLDVHKTQMKEG